jgi:hypothetical protein
MYVSTEEKMILENSLRRGATKSCTCLRREWRKPEGQLAALRTFKRGYENRAQKAGRPFNLTEGQFYTKTQQDCYICGRPPHRYVGRKRKNGEWIHTPLLVNGLDRLDASKGYTVSNTAACCPKPCNSSKGKKTVPEYASYRTAKINKLVHELERAGIVVSIVMPTG